MMRTISAATVITTKMFCRIVDFSPRNIRAMILAKIGTTAKTIAPSTDVAKNIAVICRIINPT